MEFVKRGLPAVMDRELLQRGISGPIGAGALRKLVGQDVLEESHQDPLAPVLSGGQHGHHHGVEMVELETARLGAGIEASIAGYDDAAALPYGFQPQIVI